MLDFVKKYRNFLFILAFLVAVTLLLVFITPDEIVHYIGIENAYLVSFLLAVFGGLSAVTGISFFVSVATFASGGANPFILALFGGAGIFISDSIFFFAARYGVGILEKKAKPIFSWLVSRMEKLPMKAVLAGVYVYIGFTPLPNDILMIALAIWGIPYKKLAPVLLAGSITVVFLVAYFGEIIFE
ncbi:MAG: hypothetical protein WD896_02345 [Parcubacteria group bacterium]